MSRRTRTALYQEGQMKYDLPNKLILAINHALGESRKALCEHAELTFQSLCVQDADHEDEEVDEEKFPTVH